MPYNLVDAPRDSRGWLPYVAGMPNRSRKRPRDPNQLAKLVVGLATGEEIESAGEPQSDKNPAAVELGRLGGLKGGKARAAKLSPKRRADIARRAAQARYGKR